MTRRRWLIPYLLLAPGLLWLAIFFVVPNIQMFLMSLSTPAGGAGLTQSVRVHLGVAELRQRADRFSGSSSRTR